MLEDGLDIDDQPPSGTGYDDGQISRADLDRLPVPPDAWRTWGDDDWRAWEAAEFLRECAQADADRAERLAQARERDPPRSPLRRRSACTARA